MSYGQNNGQSYYPGNQGNNLPPLREALRGVPGLDNRDPRGHVPRSSTPGLGNGDPRGHVPRSSTPGLGNGDPRGHVPRSSTPGLGNGDPRGHVPRSSTPWLGNRDPRGHVPRSSTPMPYPSEQYYDTGAVPPHGHPQSTTNVHMSVLQQGPSGGLVMRRDAPPRSTTSDLSRPYACDYPECSKRFERPVDLDTHIRSHTGEKHADTLVAGKRSLLNRT
ncbi:hypothetical protein M422DRAFT_239388 [Sphaerobolus stellatus SS14]|nr:hypothetical protein M422DRAFT_239388 [Sphaerobolus stellatus SS14]